MYISSYVWFQVCMSLIARGNSCECVSHMPSKPSAMLKSQPANTKKKIIPERSVTQVTEGFISDFSWGKQPSMNTSSLTFWPYANAANWTQGVMDLSVEQHE